MNSNGRIIGSIVKRASQEPESEGRAREKKKKGQTRDSVSVSARDVSGMSKTSMTGSIRKSEREETGARTNWLNNFYPRKRLYRPRRRRRRRSPRRRTILLICKGASEKWGGARNKGRVTAR